jgi:hypothetical protein
MYTAHGPGGRLCAKIATVKWLDGFATYSKIFYILNEKQAKRSPKIPKNSLLFTLFSGNSGITAGPAPDGPIGRLYLQPCRLQANPSQPLRYGAIGQDGCCGGGQRRS